MSSRRQVLTLVAVLGVGLVLGLTLLLNRQLGVDAEVVRAAEGGGVLLCAPAGRTLTGAEGGPARAVVLLGSATELMDQRKSSPARIQAGDLRPGQRVQIWTDGRALPGDPPQLAATRLMLLADPVAGRPSICAP